MPNPGSHEERHGREVQALVPDYMSNMFEYNPFASNEIIAEQYGVRIDAAEKGFGLILRKSKFILATFILILIGSFSMTIALWTFDRAEIEELLQREQKRNRALEWANKNLAPTQYEGDQNLFVRYVSPSNDEIDSLGTVKVLIRNVQYPCLLRWVVGDKEEVRALESGDSEFELSAGSPVSVYCEPMHKAGWLQSVLVAVIREEKLTAKPGSALGKIPLMLEDGDSVGLVFDQAIPPWNAICLPIKDEWMMITIERPWALYDADKWQEGKWDGPERFPNSAFFLASNGIESMAKDLASYFIENRNQEGKWGRFRYNHLGLGVYGKKDSVSKTMQTISQEELEKGIIEGLNLLKAKRQPLGESIEKEIEAAKVILNQALGQ